jgi:hypothetical protein
MSCKSKNLCIVVEVSSVRAVGGKSLISVVIVVENSFRSSNGLAVGKLGVIPPTAADLVRPEVPGTAST